jgi:hypothetical protein
MDHEEVSRAVPGGTEYISTFCIGESEEPIAIYKPLKPDLAKQKGYEGYVGVQVVELNGRDFVVFKSLTEKDIGDYRYQEGILCHNCAEVHYSMNEKDEPGCTCGSCYIAGGNKRLEYGGWGYPYTSEIVILDLLKPTILNEVSGKDH